MAREILAISLSKILGNFEGLTYLSLPKGTPTIFITTIVTSVNAAHGDPYHAFHVSKIASDNVISPEEATGLRSREDGSHSDVLVISREGEFKDLKSLETFRHVNPALVPSGVAGIEAGEINIHSIAISIASEIARAVEENAEVEEISITELGKGLKKVLCYLADAYLASGNHDINWKDAWWVHANSLADNLFGVVTQMFNTRDTRKGYWGCRATCIAAGLPVPAIVDEFYREPGHGPKVYAKKVQDNWNSGEAAGIAIYEVEKEARKAGRVTAGESYPLRHLDWIESFDSSIAGLGHPVLAVSQHAVRSGEHSLAWANVDENDFFEMSADNLEVSLLGNSDGGESKPLPSVSLLEPPVFIIPVGCGSFSADLRTYDLGTFILFLGIPVDNLRLSDFKLTTAPTALQVTLLELIESDAGMVLLKFGLEIKLAASGRGKWREKPYQLSIAPVISNGRVPFSLLSQISVLVPFPGDDASFYLTAKFGSKTNSKQKLVSLDDRSYTLDKTTSTITINEESLSRVVTFKADQSKLDLVVVNKSRNLRVNGKEYELIKLDEAWAEPHLASSISLVNDLGVRCGQNEFSVHIVDAETRPLSPIAAAAQGTLPTEDESSAMESELLIDPRGVVERWMSNFYQGETPNRGSLGQVVMLESENARKASIDFNHDCNFHVMGKADNFPIFQSELLDGATKGRFWDAFDNLGLTDFSQGGNGLTSDWPSRLDLRDLEKEKIERYIDAYESLVDYAIESEHHGLLVYPFSVLIFNPAKGVVTGVLLSPLHPIRLAWNWATQVSAKEVIDSDIDIDASDLMRFVDGTSLPFYGPLPFNLNSRSVAVGLDPGIEELFATWSYLCDSQITESSNSLPLELSGYVFPAAARSGLDRGGVTAAINDYLRVYPYSSDLRLGLFAQSPVPRSKELDRAVVSELDVLLKNRASQLPGGIRVLDSKNRLGQMPGKDYLLSKINAAVDYLDKEDENKLWKIPFEWKRADEGNVDMRFMEESLVTISYRSAGEDSPISTGAITMLPVRRSYAWTSVQGAGTNLSRFNPLISTGQDSELPALLSALNKVEKWDRIWETWCDVPNSSALTGRGAKWIVSGNSHIDPRLLARSLTNMQQDKVLWEWRPPFFPRRWKGAAITGAKPYTVIATLANDFKQQVTSELSDSIGAGDDTLNELFKVLGTRGVGIASLLSMGHRQSRGAIGFYLGFLLGARWEKQQVPDEIRMVLPLDAVNPVFETLGGSHDDERKKADLLMISAKRVPDGSGAFAVDLRPIEIKLHAANNNSHPFPSTSSSVVKDALKQVRNTLKILQGFINVAMTKPCPVLINTVISALVEMGISLSAHENQDVELCRDLLVAASTGKCNFTLSGGLLLWFERHGTGNGNNPFILRRSTSNDQVTKFFVDPASLHSELKSREQGQLATMLMEALGDEDSASPSTKTSPNTEVAPQVDIPEEAHIPETEKGVSAPDAGSIVLSEDLATSDVVVVEQGNTRLEIMPIPSFGKLDEVELNRKLNLIIDTLEQLGVSVFVPDHVPPFTEGPASIMFRIAPSPGVSINAIKAKMTDLKLVLHLKKQQEPRHFIEEGCFVIDVPKKDSDRYYISAQKLWESWQRPNSELAVPIGLDAFKEVVELNFSSPNSPHLLIGGTTGSGKSEALNTILYGLARHYDATELRFSLIDPKGTELIFFSEDPHLDGEIGLTADDAKYILERAVDEMDKRYALFVKSRVNGIKPYNAKVEAAERMPWWIIVLDEYADLTSDKEMKKEIEALLQRLAQKARAAGIHVIVATQKPTVDVINTVVRSNLPAQLALRVNRAIESRVIIGEDGAEALTGKGDALLNAEGQLTRFQSAMYEQ